MWRRETRAILFDFDNTLVNSASALPLAHQMTAESIVRYLHAKGRVTPTSKILKLIGAMESEMGEHFVFDRDEWWARILKLLDVEAPEEIIREWTNTYWEYYSRGAVFEDAVETLSLLKERGYSLAMVTNTDGTPGVKRRRLSSSGLQRFFDVIVVAGEDVDEVKPSPKPFIKAASLLNLGSHACVMVGDDPSIDVKGAKEAGMKAVLLDRTGRRNPSNSNPDTVIKSLKELVILF